MTRDGHETELIARGRHDPCVVPRGLCSHFPIFDFSERFDKKFQPWILLFKFFLSAGGAAVPMVEAMVALVLIDQLMAHLAQCEMFPVNPTLQQPVSPTSDGSLLMPELA